MTYSYTYDITAGGTKVQKVNCVKNGASQTVERLIIGGKDYIHRSATYTTHINLCFRFVIDVVNNPYYECGSYYDSYSGTFKIYLDYWSSGDSMGSVGVYPVSCKLYFRRLYVCGVYLYHHKTFNNIKIGASGTLLNQVSVNEGDRLTVDMIYRDDSYGIVTFSDGSQYGIIFNAYTELQEGYNNKSLHNSDAKGFSRTVQEY